MDRPVENDSDKSGRFDVIIVGGGPAGIAAALWCEDLGLKAIILEKQQELGGQLLRTFGPVTNYPGVQAANGREFRDLLVRRLATDAIIAADVADVELVKKRVKLADGKTYSSDAIVIATGVRPRELGVPGEREFRSCGILDSGTRQRDEVAGKRVVIVGGGDAALENALILAGVASLVQVIHRREQFSARPDFVEKCAANNKIELITNSTVTAITGNEHMEQIEVQNVATGLRRIIAADNLLIRIGVQPNTELFRGQIELDADGYVIINSNCSTELENVFAVGDAANRTAPTIAAAVGQASIAIKAISRAELGRSRFELIK
jgi:thioredoxin reductase (NADPH)